MYKESDFEANVKWFVVGFAGLSALCQLIMMFSEFTFFSAVGMLFNGLYHFVGFLAPGLIIFLLLKQIDNKEIYSSYSIGLFSLLGSITNICLLVKYILNTKGTEGLKVWLIILISILIILEILYSVVIVKFGLDKVTSFFVILLTIIVVIFKGCVYSSVDSKLQTYAYNTVDKSIFSVWSFMFLLFYIAMIVSLMLYLDSGFLFDVLQNPQNLFTKNTLLGTYTNLYMKDEPKSNNQVVGVTTFDTQMKNDFHEDESNISVEFSGANTIIENKIAPTHEVQPQSVDNLSIGDAMPNRAKSNGTDSVIETGNYPLNDIPTDKKGEFEEMEKENNQVEKSVNTGKNNTKLIIGLVAVIAVLLVGCAIGIGIIIGRGNNTNNSSSSSEETSVVQEDKEETTEATTEEAPITQAEAGVIYTMQKLRDNLKNPHSLKVYSIHYYVYDDTNDLFVAVEYEATNNVGGTVEDWLYYRVDGDLFSSDEKEVAAAKLVGCKSVSKYDYDKHSENEVEVDVDRIMNHIDDYEF